MSELRIERDYPIAPAALFAWITEPENLVKWWGPEGMALEDVKLDLRRPGPWSVTFVGPDKSRYGMQGTVLAVTPPHFVELTMSVPDGSLSTVRFEVAPAPGAGARLTLIQSNITDEMVAMGQRGWVSTLARLERLVTAATAA